MPELRVTVQLSEGLHARPASRFAEAAQSQPVKVHARKPDSTAYDAASVLGLMMLGARCGDELILEAEGDGAEAALATLAGLLQEPDSDRRAAQKA